MSSRSWFFLPVLKILHARNVKAQILRSCFPHSAQVLRFLIPSPLCLLPEVAEAQASAEVNIFFRSEERAKKDPVSNEAGSLFDIRLLVCLTHILNQHLQSAVVSMLG